MVAAVDMAKTIANKSPVAVQGSKVILNYSHDHSVDEGLEYVVSANMSTLVLYTVVHCSMRSVFSGEC